MFQGEKVKLLSVKFVGRSGLVLVIVVVFVWKSIHSRSDTNRTGAKGLSFLYSRLLYCPNQMLAVMVLGQHRVSSSKTVRPGAICGARCMGHAIRAWLLENFWLFFQS